MFPVNFVVGAAVGVAATYVYKDEAAQKSVVAAGKKIKAGIGSLVGSFRKKPDAEDDMVEMVSEEVDADTIVADIDESASGAKA